LSLIVGCTTKPKQPLYQPLNDGIGYSEVQLDRNTLRVTFKGNSNTSRETVETYLLYRCAEKTLEHKYYWFVITDSNTDIKQGIKDVPTTIPMFFWNEGKCKYVRTYKSKSYQEYVAMAVIKMFNGEKPKSPNTYDASEVRKYLSPHVKK
jgi:hypothetical protein